MTRRKPAPAGESHGGAGEIRAISAAWRRKQYHRNGYSGSVKRRRIEAGMKETGGWRRRNQPGGHAIGGFGSSQRSPPAASAIMQRMAIRLGGVTAANGGSGRAAGLSMAQYLCGVPLKQS